MFFLNVFLTGFERHWSWQRIKIYLDKKRSLLCFSDLLRLQRGEISYERRIAKEKGCKKGEQRCETCIHFLTPLDNHHRAQFLCFTAGHWHHGNSPVWGKRDRDSVGDSIVALHCRVHTSNSEGNWLRQIYRYM